MDDNVNNCISLKITVYQYTLSAEKYWICVFAFLFLVRVNPFLMHQLVSDCAKWIHVTTAGHQDLSWGS